MIRLALLLAMLFAVAAFSEGTLQVGSPKVEGNKVIFPIILGGDQAGRVASLDFRLNYDPAVLKPVSTEAGAAATESDKRVMANAKQPGEYIVVMMGMNQTACAPGEVAKVVMERVAESDPKQWGLDITRQTLSSPEGTVIDSRVVDPIQAAEPDTTPATEEPKEPATPSTSIGNGETKTADAAGPAATAATPGRATGGGPMVVASAPVGARSTASHGSEGSATRGNDTLARAAAEADKERSQLVTPSGAPVAEADRDQKPAAEKELKPNPGIRDNIDTAQNTVQPVALARMPESISTVESKQIALRQVEPEKPVQGILRHANRGVIAIVLIAGVVALGGVLLTAIRKRTVI